MQGICCLGLASFRAPSECVFVELVLKSDGFTLPKPGIAEGKHGTLRLTDSKRPYKKMEK